MRRGLKEFQELYDLWADKSLLALDLAQNISFKFELAKEKDIVEEDVHMAYGIIGGTKYPGNMMEAIHKLAKALGFTREDYIENADKRRGKGNMNVFVLGQGRSINTDIGDLIK